MISYCNWFFFLQQKHYFSFLSRCIGWFSWILLINLFCGTFSCFVKDRAFDIPLINRILFALFVVNSVALLLLLLSRPLSIDRFNIRLYTCPYFLPARIPIFHPSLGPEGKKRREILRGRDDELTLVEILKVSWGTLVVSPGRLLEIEANYRV